MWKSITRRFKEKAGRYNEGRYSEERYSEAEGRN
jgi:hypothetical protein